MYIKLNFHKSLHRYTDIESINIEISRYSFMVSCLETLFPKLAKYIATIKQGLNKDCLTLIEKDRVISEVEYIKDTIKESITELTLVPSIYGGGGDKSTGLMIGLALVAIVVGVGFAMAPASAGLSGAFAFANASGFVGFLGKTLLGIGINLILGSLFISDNHAAAQTPKQPEQERNNNDMFDALQNTTTTDKLVQLKR